MSKTGGPRCLAAEEVKTDEDGVFVMKKSTTRKSAVAGITGPCRLLRLRALSSAARPSMLYLIVAALTLICVNATAALTTVQYLNLYQAKYRIAVSQK